MLEYIGKNPIHFWFHGKKYVLGGAITITLDAPSLPITYNESSQSDLGYLWDNYPEAKSFLKRNETQNENALVANNEIQSEGSENLDVEQNKEAIEDGKEKQKSKRNGRAK
jgi:hypothetical protein